MKNAILICLLVCLQWSLVGQGTVYIPKGGFSMASQNWSGFSRQALFTWHGALGFEGYREGAPSTFYGQIGLHQRGSAERVSFANVGVTNTQQFIFSNASLTVGAKKRFSTDSDKNPFIAFGARVEYTVANNFSDFSQYAGYFPIEPFINKFNYGATLSFGYEFPFSEFVGGQIEASIAPDLSNQYEQPGGISVISPLTGRSIALREQRIRNLTFEISFGLRLLHKVIYTD